ncbi:MAG: hypothetical protein NTZ95_07920, partial [Candidatus Omnitrophica bacterium]|nr:hypothetical protein [Candidatus Omnitrophota bacterium]
IKDIDISSVPKVDLDGLIGLTNIMASDVRDAAASARAHLISGYLLRVVALSLAWNSFTIAAKKDTSLREQVFEGKAILTDGLSKLYYMWRAKLSGRQATGVELIAQADRKVNARKAIALYNKAFITDPALKENDEVRVKFADLLIKERDGRIFRAREYLNHPITAEERSLRRDIGRTEKALQVAPDHIKDGLNRRLIQQNEKLFTILDTRWRWSAGKAWPNLRRELSAIKVQIGRAYLEMKDIARAETAFREAEKLYPQDKTATGALADIEAGLTVSEVLLKARAYIAAEEHAKARRMLERAERLDKDKKNDADIKKERDELEKREAAFGKFSDSKVWPVYEKEYKELNAEYLALNDSNDKDGVKRREVLRKIDDLLNRSRGRLSKESKKVIDEELAVFDEWFKWRSSPPGDDVKTLARNAVIVKALQRFAGVSVTASRGIMLIEAERLLAQGEVDIAFRIFDQIAQDTAAPLPDKDKAFAGIAECWTRSTGKPENNVANAETAFNFIKDRNLKARAALKIAHLYETIASRIKSDDTKGIAAMREEAYKYFKLAITNPDDTEALTECLDFLEQTKQKERLFTDNDLRTKAIAVIAFTKEMKVIIRISVLAMEEGASQGSVEVMNAVMARAGDSAFIMTVKEDDLTEFLSILERSLRDAAMPDVKAQNAITATIGHIESAVKLDPLYKRNTALLAYTELIRGHMERIKGNRKEAVGHFEKAFAIDASKEGQSLLGIALTEVKVGELERAQDILATLAVKEPSLTPPLRRAIAEKIFARAGAGISIENKIKFLQSAVSYWPDYLKAHRQLSGLYGSRNEIYSKNREDRIVKDLDDSEARGVIRQPPVLDVGKQISAMRATVGKPVTETAVYFAAPLLILFAVASSYGFTEASWIHLAWQATQWIGAALFIYKHIDRDIIAPRTLEGRIRAYFAPTAVGLGAAILTCVYTNQLLYIAAVLAFHFGVNLIITIGNRFAPLESVGFRLAAIRESGPAVRPALYVAVPAPSANLRETASQLFDRAKGLEEKHSYEKALSLYDLAASRAKADGNEALLFEAKLRRAEILARTAPYFDQIAEKVSRSGRGFGDNIPVIAISYLLNYVPPLAGILSNFVLSKDSTELTIGGVFTAVSLVLVSAATFTGIQILGPLSIIVGTLVPVAVWLKYTVISKGGESARPHPLLLGLADRLTTRKITIGSADRLKRFVPTTETNKAIDELRMLVGELKALHDRSQACDARAIEALRLLRPKLTE